MTFKNPAHKTNFRLDIPDAGATKRFEMNVQSLTIPSMEIEPVMIQLNPQSQGMLPGSSARFDPLNIRFLLDEDLSAYVDIYKWMISIVDYAKNSSTAQDVGTVPRTVLLHVLDNSKTKILLTWRFHDAWPSMIGNIDYEYTDESNSPMTTDVTFMYKSFEIEQNGVIIRPRDSGVGGTINPGMHPFSK